MFRARKAPIDSWVQESAGAGEQQPSDRTDLRLVPHIVLGLVEELSHAIHLSFCVFSSEPEVILDRESPMYKLY